MHNGMYLHFDGKVKVAIISRKESEKLTKFKLWYILGTTRK